MAELRSPVCNFDTQKFKNNEEALELRKIFNIIEENKLKKAKEIKKNNIYFEENEDKENININVMHDFSIRPQNRHKIKTQKIFNRKNIFN